MASSMLHFFDNGNLHNPKFSPYELFRNVPNCLLWGIGPISWFCERFKNAKNVKLVNCMGIFPLSLFEERFVTNLCIELTLENWLVRRGCPKAYKHMVKLILNSCVTLGT